MDSRDSAGGKASALPPGVSDFTPPGAGVILDLQARFAAVSRRWGYQPVITPMLETAASVEQGMPESRRDQLFRLVDPLDGRVAALRPDITPQIARMVAQRMAHLPRPLRLSYEGRVMRHRSVDHGEPREIFQTGVELVGDGGIQADLEIIELALETLRACGVAKPVFDLSHMGIVRELARRAGLSPEVQARVWSMLKRKNQANLRELLDAQPGVDAGAAAMLTALTGLHGDAPVIGRAERILAGAGLQEIFAQLRALARRLIKLGVEVSVDLGEVRGVEYYTGPTFRVYAHGASHAVASGGRYDRLMGVYGKDEPAVGFALEMVSLALLQGPPAKSGVVVVSDGGDHMWATIQRLRDQGESVAVLHGVEPAAAQRYAVRHGFSLVIVPGPNGEVSNLAADDSGMEKHPGG
ncbi:MAG: ATP phosphoribosyltransferase regulatory subunit [Myxococcota bacterium]|nr:ATP phosphoribosyltransferase regulatory subunit [Myxococcota bacterium]